MLSTLTSWALLFTGLLVTGKWSCPGDKSIEEVHHVFEKYDVRLISFAANPPILTAVVQISATIHLPFDLVVLFELTFPELDAPPIHITAGIQLTPNRKKPPHLHTQFRACSSRSMHRL